MKKKFTFLSSLLSFLLVFSCSNPEKKATPEPSSNQEDTHLGDIQFEVTGAAEAQPFFKKGVLFLHSFEYEDAREAFLEAQAMDSTFVMAYWGEAMTYHHSLWQKQEKEKALAALNKLSPDTEIRLALAQTELEKDFLKAATILFGEGTKYERDVAYRNFMQELSQKHPAHHEVQAFYAISCLSSSRNGRNEELYNQTARIAQSIIAENPGHPGALHYLIHSYDDPGHAHLAKTAADSYSKIAPDAAHALHMPSHIYVALGRWDDVVTSNIASWNASIRRLERKNLEDKGGSYHAYHWMQYGLLQRGEVEMAAQLLDKMTEYVANDSQKNARRYFIGMKGAQIVETNDWTGKYANLEIEVKDLPITRRAGAAFLQGMNYYHLKQSDHLQMVIEKMQKDRLEAEQQIGEAGFAMCSAAGFANKPPNELDINMVTIMEMELQAALADLNGRFNDAKDWYEKGVALDEELNYSFGPPVILKPVQEAYGEWLFQQKRYEEALVVFEKSLQRHPRRLLSLKGRKAAAKALKKAEIIAEMEQELAVSLAEKERGEVL